MTYVLGINAYQADAAAVLLEDGKLVAAAAEERFRRVKHWMGTPHEAVRRCLDIAGIEGDAIGYVALAGDPRTNRMARARYLLARRPSPRLLLERFRYSRAPRAGFHSLAESLAHSARDGATFRSVEHHLCHLASAFFVSPFHEAAVCAIDGFGDFVSTSWGVGRGNRLQILSRIYYPHSLGALYTAVTQHLGFPIYGDEYKVMALAAAGEPRFRDSLRSIVRLKAGGGFQLDASFFRHGRAESFPPWQEGDPTRVVMRLCGPEMTALLGPPREPGMTIDDRHRDVAASLQAVFEETVVHVLREVWRRTRTVRLCLAGGCMMNSVLAGKIRGATPFQEIFIQPAAGDAGTALGAAYALWHGELERPRSFVMQHAFWGPAYGDRDVTSALARVRNDQSFEVRRFDDDAAMCAATADIIAGGAVVGWFCGRMEWGERALGARSILADPRRADMREILNTRIKLRENFRPFAASVLERHAGTYYEDAAADPFMLQVHPVRPEMRPRIPAVTHVDGSGRVQTVTPDTQPVYAELLRAFQRRTGLPLLLNTSFNENEPIVDTPAQALDCFVRTSMDALVMERTLITRRSPDR